VVVVWGGSTVKKNPLHRSWSHRGWSKDALTTSFPQWGVVVESQLGPQGGGRKTIQDLRRGVGTRRDQFKKRRLGRKRKGGAADPVGFKNVLI